MKKSVANSSQSASELISERIAELGDWRGKTLARMRKLIKQADPDVVEEWKWMGTPVWSHDGITCTGETYKGKVKLTFAKGRHWRMRGDCLIRVWMGGCGGRLILGRGRRLMRGSLWGW